MRTTKGTTEFVGNHEESGLPIYRNAEGNLYLIEADGTKTIVDEGSFQELQVAPIEFDAEGEITSLPEVINSDMGFYLMFGFNPDVQFPATKNLNSEMHTRDIRHIGTGSN